MKTIAILTTLLILSGCAYDPERAAAYQRDCRTVTYSKSNGRLGMSTVCNRGGNISIMRNM